jgi:hypothetical protein
MIRRGKYANASDNFRTDKWILEMFRDFFDPCPFNPDYVLDGLTDVDWPERVFINPPYSNVTPWIDKAINHARRGGLVVMLLKHDSSTKWFAKIHEFGADILMCRGRLKHQLKDIAPFPSILVVFWKEEFEWI